MKISDIMKERGILPNLASRDKLGALRDLANLLVTTFKLKEDAEKLVKILEDREKLGSTGIGDGIAIPHGKLSSLKEELLVLGRSKEGIDFNSMDGKPTYLFFLLMGPEEAAGIHLKALARLSRLLKNALFRDSLMKAGNSVEMMEMIKLEDSKY
ncbi:MAG: PTS fructose transporter subunit IIA [Candidatus Schekmanbacteria bacterium RIFCSPHIGHO2_02_FULL_38_11]|uniref:PTS fructose transporter subunit IIA n=1 Tax=Candidatus Schekmanbacteria bacterium RIFCSPLOWO2_12_FULL_38_15 TaxID=1817883 RepID=A0A1F7SMT3_9BACT|nr:MAG: PTS fructose transporter subunit IIA [Candidatus Schekmanbacteria bacterium GWA2_38_9]OGL48697.1 MAG: PTS fructose transporter subunit IIA [Candidatus Schekmanbacteria bacterium RIFCSPHIGHO2_02_FULL_38_11]OGL51083.1 MAG: PTS fructose transporter subunit IIA [Candidatus Schekmanbacteria bacterium RIFCSPLOWO2_02_FULL_38_14]OGL55083.1 MAG: PTS fructose transporter subunit IIA [Candidatus Schekmanbacteria bacterium RIFCSPLOWO2_12_FULL_38_15]